jgi:nitroreductase
MTIRDAIQERVSTRTFSDKPIDHSTRTALQELLEENIDTPFGNSARFQLIEKAVQKEKLGTYGFIKNASAFIAGAITDAPFARVDFGFQLEKIILELTRMRLATCWLGGTFTRTSFGEAMNLQQDEFIPCITPVGFPAAEQRFTEKLIRRAAGSDERKPWNELFFQDNLNTTLVREDTGDYEVVLDMLRLAPSASNKQPWRIIKNHDFYHLVLQRTRGYKNQFKSADLQMVDMGIAMCHWSMMAAEMELTGQWKRLHTEITMPTNGEYEYVASWLV